MSTKIYVGNLPFTVTNEELKELFAKFGEVSEAVVISNKYTNRSKGFGFVTFADEESAKKAIAEMNDQDVQGRAIKVSEARPMKTDE